VSEIANPGFETDDGLEFDEAVLALRSARPLGQIGAPQLCAGVAREFLQVLG